MKQIKIYLFALLAVLSMAACGSSDDGDGNGSNEINTNKNVVTTDKAVTRLEFPKLKGGNSIIRVYRDGNSKQYDPDNVNYAVEWDCDKKSQRWSCYIITKQNSGNPDNIKRYYSQDNQYPYDPDLAASNRWEKDYIYSSGFDHGHICPSTIVCIIPKSTIKLSISPICSHNMLCLTEAIKTIHIQVFGSRWRTIYITSNSTIKTRCMFARAELSIRRNTF